jgi:hypothetical protein
LRRVSASSSRSSAEEEMVEVAASIRLSPLLSQASPPLFPSSVASLFLAELAGRRSLKLAGAAACPCGRSRPGRGPGGCMQDILSPLRSLKSPRANCIVSAHPPSPASSR